ncbi:hypothetical protein IQ268_20125 [Oculatella sp. LEGE 06141]|uniref:hypothetical protein n=1 Tax=Oculatella sp. LEGE 06141 TaxID=1828648 RepID=UPI0018805A4B|nr:hypothetical protein [Oculatella sp. LEGE 06141]MBE9180870.1 hypothetical protein [Oculatella sp. LEGE 06141]
MTAKDDPKHSHPSTFVVSEEVFKQVYDSPHSLPGKEKWVTRDEDVREIERLLGMEPRAIGAPLWVSGDTRCCPNCGRETNWLDIVGSALSQVHRKEMLVKVILGNQKYVNVEAPRAIADLQCYQCQTPIVDLRSFKCHNWAYAIGDLLQVLQRIGIEPRETTI